jgi:hypothetical protein
MSSSLALLLWCCCSAVLVARARADAESCYAGKAACILTFNDTVVRFEPNTAGQRTRSDRRFFFGVA